MIGFLLGLMGVCPHAETIRERRAIVVDGQIVDGVMCFVCRDCDHRIPVVDRTADEHQRVHAQGAPAAPVVHRHTGTVVPMLRRRP